MAEGELRGLGRMRELRGQRGDLFRRAVFRDEVAGGELHGAAGDGGTDAGASAGGDQGAGGASGDEKVVDADFEEVDDRKGKTA